MDGGHTAHDGAGSISDASADRRFITPLLGRPHGLIG